MWIAPFSTSWWKYVFAPKNYGYTWFETIVCRIRGHDGPIWYNPGGSEPNMHCTGCGDDLG